MYDPKHEEKVYSNYVHKCTSNKSKFDSTLKIKRCHRQSLDGQAHKGFTKACQKRENMKQHL